MKHTGTITAWMTPYNTLNADQLRDPKCIHQLSYSHHNMAPEWIKVGTAEVTLTLETDADITNNAIAALRVEQQQVRADAEIKAQKIERRIQTLLAITMDVEGGTDEAEHYDQLNRGYAQDRI